MGLCLYMDSIKFVVFELFSIITNLIDKKAFRDCFIIVNF